MLKNIHMLSCWKQIICFDYVLFVEYALFVKSLMVKNLILVLIIRRWLHYMCINNQFVPLFKGDILL